MQTPSRYDWKIVESEAKPKSNKTNKNKKAEVQECWIMRVREDSTTKAPFKVWNDITKQYSNKTSIEKTEESVDQALSLVNQSRPFIYMCSVLELCQLVAFHFICK